MTKRWNFSDKFRAAVAFETLRGEKAVQKIAGMAALRQDCYMQKLSYQTSQIAHTKGTNADLVEKVEICLTPQISLL